MKNLLKTVRDSIAAAMNGRTIEQMETEQLKQNVKNAVDDYLIRHPDWQPSTKPAPAVAPVTNTKQKTAKIKRRLVLGQVASRPTRLIRKCSVWRGINAARWSPQTLNAIRTSSNPHRLKELSDSRQNCRYRMSYRLNLREIC
jgi:hypothetical protein